MDFFCAERALAIELDGSQHYAPQAQAYDARRTAYLRDRGITVLRFPSDVMLREPHSVLVAIAAAVRKGRPSP